MNECCCVCKVGVGRIVSEEQCDQMVFYSFHHLSIYCCEKLPNCIQHLPKSATIFAKY